MAETGVKKNAGKKHKGVKKTRSYGEKRKRGKHSTREATKFAAGRRGAVTVRSI